VDLETNTSARQQILVVVVVAAAAASQELHGPLLCLLCQPQHNSRRCEDGSKEEWQQTNAAVEKPLKSQRNLYKLAVALMGLESATWLSQQQ
jgi:hypothetical protein